MEGWEPEGLPQLARAMEPEDLMAELDGLQVDDSSVKKTRRLASKKGSSNLGIENVRDDDG